MTNEWCRASFTETGPLRIGQERWEKIAKEASDTTSIVPMVVVEDKDGDDEY